MKNIMKKLAFLVAVQVSILHAITASELLEVHKATTTEMNNINTPKAGSLIYNTTENTLFFYTGAVWKRLRSTGSETVINAGNGVAVTGTGTATVPYSIEVN